MYPHCMFTAFKETLFLFQVPTLATDANSPNSLSRTNHQEMAASPQAVNNQNLKQNLNFTSSEETSSYNVDSKNVIRSIFHGTQIHGGVFNININLSNLQTPTSAKRPRMENES